MRFRILPYSWESPQAFEHKHDIDRLEFSAGMSLGTWMKQRSNKDRESRQKSVMGAQVIKKNYTETNMISTNFLSCHRIKNYMEQYFPNLSCLYSLLTLLKTWLGYGLEKHKPRVRKKNDIFIRTKELELFCILFTMWCWSMWDVGREFEIAVRS